jgi:hypothetical protein
MTSATVYLSRLVRARSLLYATVLATGNGLVASGTVDIDDTTLAALNAALGLWILLAHAVFVGGDIAEIDKAVTQRATDLAAILVAPSTEPERQHRANEAATFRPPSSLGTIDEELARLGASRSDLPPGPPTRSINRRP